MKNVDSDSLKCLVFLSGLTDPSHCDTRLRLLNRLNCLKENDPSPTLDDFVNDCETYVALKSDNRTMESKDVNVTRHSTGYGKQRRRPSRSVNFGRRSTSREAPREPPQGSSSTQNGRRTRFPPRKSRSRQRNVRCNITSAATLDARTYLKVEINGFPTRLQLDTGSDVTMISRRTWTDMGSPTITRATMPIRTADGTPSLSSRLHHTRPSPQGHNGTRQLLRDRVDQPARTGMVRRNGAVSPTQGTVSLSSSHCSAQRHSG